MMVSVNDDYQRIAEAVAEARSIQEFIWADESLSLRPYDTEAWRRVFQKQVDAIAAIDMNQRGGLPMLRKRLLQQAALSIKALAVVDKMAGDNHAKD